MIWDSRFGASNNWNLGNHIFKVQSFSIFSRADLLILLHWSDPMAEVSNDFYVRTTEERHKAGCKTHTWGQCGKVKNRHSSQDTHNNRGMFEESCTINSVRHSTASAWHPQTFDFWLEQNVHTSGRWSRELCGTNARGMAISIWIATRAGALGCNAWKSLWLVNVRFMANLSRLCCSSFYCSLLLRELYPAI